MKILLLYVDVGGKDITDPVISGGTEKFSRLIYENFDVEVVNIPWSTRTNDNKLYKSLIIKTVEDVKADIILSNNLKSVCSTLIKNIGTPILHITHTNYGILTSAQMLNDLLEHHHSLFGVSEFNISYHKDKAKRLGFSEPEFSGIIRPAFVDKRPKKVIINPELDSITVGRANSYKAPFLLSKYIDSKYKIITSLGVDQDSIEYYERNKHIPHIKDLPHELVMKEIANSASMFQSCPIETFGITALEALSVGTPLIIRTNGDGIHASQEIPASKEYYRNANSKTEFTNALKELIKIDRVEIAESTAEKHSKEKWINSIEKAIEYTIHKYQKHSTPINTLF